jgi:hypothetical protein
MTLLNTPEGWSEFENAVRLAVAHQNDAELTRTVAELQRNFQRDRKPSQHETLQALYREQHRRLHS